MASKTAKSSTGHADMEKAKEIFKRVREDFADGRRADSQVRRDGEMIVYLLSEGGAAKAGVFSQTFAELFGIDRKHAGQRVRNAMADLISAGKVTKTEEARPSYSLKQTSDK